MKFVPVYPPFTNWSRISVRSSAAAAVVFVAALFVFHAVAPMAVGIAVIAAILGFCVGRWGGTTRVCSYLGSDGACFAERTCANDDEPLRVLVFSEAGGWSGKPRMSLRAPRDGSSSLDLYDKNGKPRMWLSVVAGGSPGLELYDKNGRSRVALSTGVDESSGLDLYDKTGKKRVSLRTYADGSPGLRLYDKHEKARALLGVSSIFDRRTGAETKTTEGALTLLDPRGNAIWKAPR